MLRILLCALSLLLAPAVFAAPRPEIDNIRFDHTPLNVQLPARGINQVMQDHRGYLWIATHDGLCRYDGHSLRVFRNDPADSTSLGHDYVRGLFEDSHRRLWIYTEGGVCRYDRAGDRFVGCTADGEPMPGSHAFAELRDGRVVTARNGILYCYDEAADDFRPLGDRLGPAPFPMRVNDLYEAADGLLWVATDVGMRWFDLRRMVSAPSPVADDPLAPELERSMTVMRVDDRSRIWMGGWAGLWVYDPHEGTLRALRSGVQGPNVRRTIAFDAQGNAWVGSENGIDIFDGDLLFRRHLWHGVSDVSGLSDNAVYSICRDRAGNMWVGTYFGGVDVAYAHAANFTVYAAGYSDRHLGGRAVRQIISPDDRTLWIATEDGGLNRLDRATREFRHYVSPEDEVGVSYHNVHALLDDRDGRLWVGTYSGGLTCYDPATGRTTYPVLPVDSIRTIGVFALEEDPDGDIWIGTTRGLFRRRAGAREIERVRPRVIWARFVYCLAADAAGGVWIGTRGSGLYRYDKFTGEAEALPGRAGQHFVTALLADPDGGVWAGTDGGGLRYFAPGAMQSITLTTADGLLSNAVRSLVRDGDGCLWIATDEGLSRYDPALRRFTNFTLRDGLPSDDFNYSSAYCAADGELFFGLTDGMISFYPHALHMTRPALRVEFSELQVLGRTAAVGGEDSPLRKALSESRSIRLTYRQAASFALTYSALNFDHAPTIRYAIRLEGIDARWHDVGNQHQVLYANLPHGRYRLGVRASYDGVRWDDDGARWLDIEIAPPFWLTGWAYALYALLAGGVVLLAVGVVRGRVRFVERLNAERTAKRYAERMNVQKMNFFANISHDMKTPLTLVVGPLQRIVEEKGTDPVLRERIGVVLRNARRMRSLLEELLLLSKIDMGYMKITVQQGDLLAFIDHVCDIFRLFASDNGIHFMVNIDYRHRDVWFSPGNVERIVYNLLSNAFKFTPSGGIIRVKAALSTDERGQERLHLSVKDNGIGIAPDRLEHIFDNYYSAGESGAPAGTGIGLSLTRSLVQLHHGTIAVESREGEGSTFRVELNVDRAAYTEEQISPIRAEETSSLDERFVQETGRDLVPQAEPETRLRNRRRFRLLVVEDNEELRAFVKQIFEEQFDVLQAADGAEGYELAVQEMPDLIISDVMMPGMDGFAMTRKLKSDLQTSHIPIVLLTAKVHEQDKIEGFEVGADAYIAKPFNTQRLELQVRNLLNTRENNIRRFKHDASIDTQRLTKNPCDERFLKEIVEVIMRNLSNESFSVEQLSRELGYSRSFLYVKLKNLVDLSPSEFVRTVKMKEARERLMQGMNVSETSFAVGISDPNYFTKCFKKQFGQTPSEFLKSLK